MLKRPFPETIRNPYPDSFHTISDIVFETGLMLVRLKDAVQVREGEDADYILGAEYRVSYLLDGRERHQIIVPRGLITDLTSVPPAARWYVGRVGAHLEAAILHDYLYIAWQDISGRPPNDQDRDFADAFMLAAMKASAVRWDRRQIVYRAVKWFGGRPFFGRNENRYLEIWDPAVVAQFPSAVATAFA